ncbi:MAG: S1 RNA-binding domain-containing protein, partial [Clostridia bacterium]|nr:S1 RNA-binding domain-containing protein [Clostridia bacterium]
MKRDFYFDSQYGLETFALCVDGKLMDYRAEPAATGAVIGNIYKGRVTNVLNGMQAAFVDCGLERHCYISVADLTADGSRLEGGEIDIPATLDLHEGDEILVQITKAAQGKK